MEIGGFGYESFRRHFCARLQGQADFCACRVIAEELTSDSMPMTFTSDSMPMAAANFQRPGRAGEMFLMPNDPQIAFSAH